MINNINSVFNNLDKKDNYKTSEVLYNCSTMSISLESVKSNPISISSNILKDSSSKALTNSDLGLQNSLNNYLNIEKIENDFDVITDKFESTIFESIKESNNCMLPCFNVVCNKSSKKPSGLFAVIDIGGSTLRVSVVKFLDTNIKAECIVNKSWTICDSNKHLDEYFFEWMVNKFQTLINNDLSKDLKDENNFIKVGITWSFPIIQNVSSNRGIVSDLGKGFSICDKFKNKDLKDIFEESFKKYGILIKIYAIVNDSISVFVTGSYFNNAKLGLVQGTGINSCFLINSSLLSEKKKKILPQAMNNSEILINAEASFLGYHLVDYICNTDRGMNNLWELMLDENIKPPHLTTDDYGVFQPLEVITSGRYIPEVIRRIFVERVSPHKSIIRHKNYEYSLSAEFLANLYQCKNLTKYKSELENLTYFENLKIDDLNILKIIIETVIYRASLILASYIIALVRVTNLSHLNELEISVVGSMFQYFPGYKDTVLNILEIESNKRHFPKISFDFIKDSSIYGASIAASVNHQKSSS